MVPGGAGEPAGDRSTPQRPEGEEGTGLPVSKRFQLAHPPSVEPNSERAQRSAAPRPGMAC
ncbi:hypothetical protein GCM10017788_46160 [Amycolatopsis acidiphila]|nr:hypothetical protein GCM10017788_46160 [Amycolatopsis acidiphila]